MRVAVVFNARSGTAVRRSPEDRRADLARAFEAAGVDASFLPLNPDSVERDVRQAIVNGANAVVAAGGDGTVSSVAGFLADTNVPLGIIPLGTLNHFARDAGVPIDLEEAIRVIAGGRARAVDVAEVNGRCFVNNSSIGLYPHLVTRRERRQERLGYGKWLAMLAALVSLFRRYPVVSVVMETAEERVPRTTPFVFVGNNRYTADGLMIGTRERLDESVLSVYFANRTGRFGLFRLAFRALLGRLQQAADFDSLTAPVMQIHTRKKTLKVSVDGEVVRLAPPLVYRIRPGALRLIAP
jgi:diacylglycerol kinase family enzyme